MHLWRGVNRMHLLDAPVLSTPQLSFVLPSFSLFHQPVVRDSIHHSCFPQPSSPLVTAPSLHRHSRISTPFPLSLAALKNAQCEMKP